MDSMLVVILIVVFVSIIFAGLAGAVNLFKKLQYRLEFHDYQFEPMEPMMLPPRASHHFEQHTPRLEILGFHRIGDFQLQPAPCPAVARYFISRDGCIFGGLDDYEGTRTYSFFSIFEDGTYLETGKAHPIAQPRGDMDRLRFVFVPEGSIDEVYQRHCKAIERFQKKHGGLLAFDTDQFKEVVEYGHRLVHWSAFRQGLAYAPPTPEPTETLGA